jgi:hypothetical protein
VTASIYVATPPPGVFSSMTRHAEGSRVAELELCAPVFERHDVVNLEILVRTARELAERAGHSRPSVSLDVHSHVMPPDEASSERLQRLLR